MHKRIDGISVMVAFAIASGWLLAQNNVPLQFEAATIRLNKGPGMGQGAEDVSVADGRVRIINIPLRMLIRVAALGPRDTRPIIGPPVLDGVRDRLKLVSHFEDRDMPAYALVRLRAEPKLKETPGEPGQCQLQQDADSRPLQERIDAGNPAPSRTFSFDWVFEPDNGAHRWPGHFPDLGLGLKPAKLPVPAFVVDTIASSPSE